MPGKIKSPVSSSLIKKIEKLHDSGLHDLCLSASNFKKDKWGLSGWTNVVVRTEYAKKCVASFHGGGLLRDLSGGEKITEWLSGCELNWNRLAFDRAHFGFLQSRVSDWGNLVEPLFSNVTFLFVCLGGILFESCQRCNIPWQVFDYFPEFL